MPVPKKTEPDPLNPLEALSFEEATAQLEAVVEAMESDQIPLEELIRRYEEGSRLVKVCAAKLDDAEKRILKVAGLQGDTAILEEFGGAGSPDDGDKETIRF